MRTLLIPALGLWLFASITPPVRAQYDVTTQPPQIANNAQPQTVWASNYGQFISTATGVQLIGNDGQKVSEITGLTSTSNIAIAGNHYNQLAIVTSSIESGVPTITARVFGQLPAHVQDPDQYLRMGNPNVLSGDIPPVTATAAIVPGSGTGIRWINCAMCGQDLWITWQTNARRLGYMAVHVENGRGIDVAPSDVLDPMSAPAIGSIPTVACTHFGDAKLVHIAYERDQSPSNIPVDFTVDMAHAYLTHATQLVQPPVGDKVIWVNVQSFDDVFGASTAVSYWYGTTNPISGASSGKLYATDGVTIDMTKNPVTNQLLFDPTLASVVPPMSVADGYAKWTDGSQSVFLVYRRRDEVTPTDGTSYISICRQSGTADKLDIYHSLGEPIPYYTVASNQMGTFSLLPINSTPAIWRNFQGIKVGIVENTLATGLVAIDGNADGSPATVTLLKPGAYFGDTLRTYGSALSGQSLFFRNPNTTFQLGVHFDAIPFSPDAAEFLEQLSVNVLDLSYGTQVDFKALPNCKISAQSDGVYSGIINDNGVTFANMNLDYLEAIGNHWYPDDNADQWDYPFERATINFNAPCTLTGGGGLHCEYARVNFAPASTQAAMALLQITGSGTNISMDSTDLNMGSTSLTDGLQQIVLNPANTSFLGQSLVITNSNIWTGWPFQATPADPPDQGYATYFRSDILAKKPDHVTLNNNSIMYVHTQVDDPVTDVEYNFNVVRAAREALYLTWNQLSSYSGTINVAFNGFNETWPLGSTHQPMVDVHLYNFKVSNIDKIVVKNNAFYQYPLVGGLSDQLDGVFFDAGTNGDILYNAVRDKHNIGIHTTGFIGSRPFLCSNDIFGSPCCTPISIGILQDGYGAGYTKLNSIVSCGTGIEALDHNASDLIENSCDSNSIGGLFGGNATTLVNGSHTGTDDYAAFNFFLRNSSEQVAIQNSAQPFFGPATSGTMWSNNRFESENGQPLMSYLSGTLTLINEVSSNDWSPGISVGVIPVNGDPKMVNLGYTDNLNVSMSNPNVSCGVGYIPAKDGKGHTLSTPRHSLDVPDSLRLFNKAHTYDRIDPKKGRDTMWAYCEQHPFATVLPGEWRYGFNYEAGQAGDYWLSLSTEDPEYMQSRLDEFNWMVKIQPYNREYIYQEAVISGLATCAQDIDYNLACNLWYNYTLLFPQDSYQVAEAWRTIAAIRASQKRIPQDTTAFTVLTFPLKPLGHAAVSMAAVRTLGLDLLPNPADARLEVRCFLPSGGYVTAAIYDALGREIRPLVSRSYDRGNQKFDVDTHDLPTGTYFVRLATGSEVLTRQLVVQR